MSTSTALPKILIVEDDLGFQAEYAFFLKGKADICAAYKLDQADELYRHHKGAFALIVMDACVPGRDPNSMPFIKKVRAEGFANPMVAASGVGEFRDLLMIAGCSHDSGGKGNVKTIVESILENQARALPASTLIEENGFSARRPEVNGRDEPQQDREDGYFGPL